MTGFKCCWINNLRKNAVPFWVWVLALARKGHCSLAHVHLGRGVSVHVYVEGENGNGWGHVVSQGSAEWDANIPLCISFIT